MLIMMLWFHLLYLHFHIRNNKPDIGHFPMKQIPETPSVSSSSPTLPSSIPAPALWRIEQKIMEKVLSLKTHKISLLSELSGTLDRKHQVESLLIAQIKESTCNKQGLVTEDEYRRVVTENTRINGILTNLQKKINDKAKAKYKDKNRSKSVVLDWRADKYMNRSGYSKAKGGVSADNHSLDLVISKDVRKSHELSEEQLVDQILQLRLQNTKLQQSVPSEHLSLLQQRLSLLTKRLNKIQSSSSHDNQSPSVSLSKPQHLSVLQKYIEQEQQEKRELLVDVEQFVQHMQKMRNHNVEMKGKLASMGVGV